MPPIKGVLSVDGVKRRVQSRCYEVLRSSSTHRKQMTKRRSAIKTSHRIMNIEIYRLINLPEDRNKFYLSGCEIIQKFKKRMGVSSTPSIDLLVIEDKSTWSVRIEGVMSVKDGWVWSKMDKRKRWISVKDVWVWKWMNVKNGWMWKMDECERWISVKDGWVWKMDECERWISVENGWVWKMDKRGKWMNVKDGWV